MEKNQMGELNQQTYKTTEIARMIGMSDETVRRRMRLLSPPATPLGFGNHIYSRDDVQRLLKAFKKVEN
jgi:hypothetical protein